MKHDNATRFIVIYIIAVFVGLGLLVLSVNL